jgi:hypothetical protein
MRRPEPLPSLVWRSDTTERRKKAVPRLRVNIVEEERII